jgi:predicted AlkP superfamily pyrophosphatase or phosphodiesterase
MLNDASIQAVNQAQWNPRFIKPLYDSYCFTQLPGLIKSAFTSDPNAIQSALLGPLSAKYDKVVLFFIDAFGWRFFEKYADGYPFLRRILDEGYVSKITSQFPSTTAAHVTDIHTGLPVDQSGVFEWFYYEPVLDAMIAPLLFSYAGDTTPGTLLADGVKPQDIFPYPVKTLYNQLGDMGVRSVIYQDASFTPSPHGALAFNGAEVVPFATLREGLVQLSTRIKHEASPAYYFLYFDGIDHAGHAYGPDSEQFDTSVAQTMTLLEKLVQPALDKANGKTLFLMTADHGQTHTNPATTIYLNRERPAMTRYTRTNRKGTFLAPGGSARDLFLYIKEEYLDEAHAAITDLVRGRAEVYRTSDLIAQHFFGSGTPAQRFLDRVGNLVVLPYEGESVFWYEQGRFDNPFRGHHGGLTRHEMETILLARSS